jgi:Mn2+/Fe2+ NRAMP family transporter
VVAAATLHPASITTVATSDQAARARRPLAGDLAGLLFALGIVGVGLLGVPVLAGCTGYHAVGGVRLSAAVLLATIAASVAFGALFLLSR